MKKTYNIKTGSLDNNENVSNISELNSNIDLIYNIIYNNFKFYMLKQRYEFKKEVLTSMIFNNSNLNIKKVIIEVEVVENLLKNLRKAIALKSAKGGGSQILNTKYFNVFTEENELAEKARENQNKSSDIKSQKKITLYIDTKFLRNYKGFITKITLSEDSNFNYKDKQLIRCDVCAAIVPKCFVNVKGDIEKYSLIKKFLYKGKKLWNFTNVLKHKKFPKNVAYDSINKIKESLEQFRDECDDYDIDDYISEAAGKLHSYLLHTPYLDLEKFTNEIIKHIKMQIKHYNKLKKFDKITNDIQDAIDEYETKSKTLEKDLDSSITNLKRIQEFNFTICDNKEEIEKLKSELSINGKSIRKLDSTDLKYRQVICFIKI